MATFLSFSTTRHVDCSDLIMRIHRFEQDICVFPSVRWSLFQAWERSELFHEHTVTVKQTMRKNANMVLRWQNQSHYQNLEIKRQKLTSSSPGLRITGIMCGTRTSQCWCFPRVIPLSVSQAASSLSRQVLLPWIMSMSKIIPRLRCPTTMWEAGPRGWPSCRWL